MWFTTGLLCLYMFLFAMLSCGYCHIPHSRRVVISRALTFPTLPWELEATFSPTIHFGIQFEDKVLL